MSRRSGVLVVLVASAGCSLVTNVSNLTGGLGDVDAGPALRVIGGTVRGLDTATVTLANNSRDFFTVEHDGPFAFPAKQEDGTGYIVTVLRTSDGRPCRVSMGEGVATGADVTSIDVECPSTNAQLSNLTISSGPLAPLYSPAVASYVAPRRAADIFSLDAKVTVTATTDRPGAKLTIHGVPASSGVATELEGLHPGANTIPIMVRAADGVTEKAYSIAIPGDPPTVYLKPSNKSVRIFGFRFGTSVAVSGDGNTVAVGAPGEGSPSSGVNGDQTNIETSATTGAVYVFRRTGKTWAQEAYVKASNARVPAAFGGSVTLSGDGNTLAVGSAEESSAAEGIGGDQLDTSAKGRGAVYVFRRSGVSWAQESYIKSSDGPERRPYFGVSIALSADGTALAVGASSDVSASRGINGDPKAVENINAGAVYLFRHAGTTWTREAYIKPSNEAKLSEFGWSVAVSSDGTALAVGAPRETSLAKGLNGNQDDTSGKSVGAAYLFVKTGMTWKQDAYVKASNARNFGDFGKSVAISGDGLRVAVGAPLESSAAVGVGGDDQDENAPESGAVYVLSRTAAGSPWSQEAYVKASNCTQYFRFGRSVALSADGRRLLVGSPYEESPGVNLNGDQKTTTLDSAGAAYAFLLTGTTWSQKAYVKASNTSALSLFGVVAMSSDGSVVAIGASTEQSAATGVNPVQTDRSLQNGGAVYLFQ